MMMLYIAPLLVIFLSSSPSKAWGAVHAFGSSSSSSFAKPRPTVVMSKERCASPIIVASPSRPSLSSLALLRGGQQGDYAAEADVHVGSEEEDLNSLSSSSTSDDNGSKLSQSLGTLASVAVLTPLSSIASFYAHQLKTWPIQTKSITAGIIFGLSDYFAQTIERGNNGEGEETKKAIVQSRILSTFLVGLLIFGPAANWWYSTMFKTWPSTALLPTLIKAFLGQLLFGPAFTCIFFAAGMIQSGTFSFTGWINKIKQDLPSVAASGAGFWMPVSFVSYKFIPEHWIPLFTNVCSFVWTIYLSLVSNRGSKE